MSKKEFNRHFTAILAAVALALFVRAYIAQAYHIPSESMENTLLVGDHIIVEKISPRFAPPERGDIVVFKSPHGGKTLIKRVIGLPGERLEIKNNTVYIGGEPLAEPYVHFERTFFSTMRDFGPLTVPAGHVFALGDNRNNSGDSRVFGPVDLGLIVGKAIVVHWSWLNDSYGVRWDRLGKAIN